MFMPLMWRVCYMFETRESTDVIYWRKWNHYPIFSPAVSTWCAPNKVEKAAQKQSKKQRGLPFRWNNKRNNASLATSRRNNQKRSLPQWATRNNLIFPRGNKIWQQRSTKKTNLSFFFFFWYEIPYALHEKSFMNLVNPNQI